MPREWLPVKSEALIFSQLDTTGIDLSLHFYFLDFVRRLNGDL